MTDKKALALIAHDNKKPEMVEFAVTHQDVLKNYDLCATEGTGKLLEDEVGLDLEKLLSGSIGGDAQIAAKVAQGDIGAVFFFVDPLSKHPHDPDIQGLLRICDAHNIPLATNPATAAYIISDKAL